MVSEWAVWTLCDNICSGSRTRQRSILRPAILSQKCDYALIEQELCFEGRNCETLKRNWEEWTTCRPSADKSCGYGYKYKRSNCLYGQEITDANKCIKLGPADLVLSFKYDFSNFGNQGNLLSNLCLKITCLAFR